MDSAILSLDLSIFLVPARAVLMTVALQSVLRSGPRVLHFVLFQDRLAALGPLHFQRIPRGLGSASELLSGSVLGWKGSLVSQGPSLPTVGDSWGLRLSVSALLMKAPQTSAWRRGSSEGFVQEI